MKSFLLKIITPEGIALEETVLSVTLPVQDGEVTILPEHIPYIAALKAGEMVFQAIKSESATVLVVSGGFVEFHDNTLVVLADTTEHVDAIDIARAQDARKRAEMLMKQTKQSDSADYARVIASLEKQLTRIRIARKYRK